MLDIDYFWTQTPLQNSKVSISVGC